jgi:hypothetical protein
MSQQQQDLDKTENGQLESSSAQDAGVRPFCNGTEGYDWQAANCDRCAKNGAYDEYGEGPCPMETAVSRGFILGTVPAALAVEYGATLSTQPGYCRMPRQCSQFAPEPTCEWIAWPGTRRRQKCDEPMVATVDANGLTRAVCARHLKRAAAEHPERAPVLAVDPSRSSPATAVAGSTYAASPLTR